MKVLAVKANARRRAFEIRIHGRTLAFPYAKADPSPTSDDPVIHVSPDPELGREAFTYGLRSGRVGTVHVDQVLEFNKDPIYMRNIVLYKLTLEAKRLVAASRLSKRELIRRLDTSATQFYRLLDQTNYTKSVDQMLRLLNVLECDIDFVVHEKCA